MLEVVPKKNEKIQEELPDISQRAKRENSNVGTTTRLVISRKTVGKEKNLGSVQEDEGPLRCNPSFQKQHHVTKKYINPILT